MAKIIHIIHIRFTNISASNKTLTNNKQYGRKNNKKRRYMKPTMQVYLLPEPPSLKASPNPLL